LYEFNALTNYFGMWDTFLQSVLPQQDLTFGRCSSLLNETTVVAAGGEFAMVQKSTACCRRRRRRRRPWHPLYDAAESQGGGGHQLHLFWLFFCERAIAVACCAAAACDANWRRDDFFIDTLIARALKPVSYGKVCHFLHGGAARPFYRSCVRSPA
jgi:hypothetical protein